MDGDSDVGDRFEMLVAESLCWRFSQYIKSVTNILNPSPTSQTLGTNTRHQHIWSPTSVTNIDVTNILPDCQAWDHLDR